MRSIAEYWSGLKVKSILTALVLSSGAGFLFSFLGIPLPWILGPFFTTLSYSNVSGQKGFWPIGLREAALVVLGYSLGRQITAEATRQIVISFPLMLTATTLLILFSCLLGYVTSRKTGISLASGVLGSIPGGTMQMVILAEEIKDADRGIVLLMQIPRLLVTLLVVPFMAQYGLSGLGLSTGSSGPVAAVSPTICTLLLLGLVAATVGAWIGRRLKLPMPSFLGVIFAMAILTISGYETSATPRVLLNAAQLSLAAYVGCGINIAALRRLGKVSVFAFGGAIALVCFTLFLGYALTLVTSASLVTGFLAMAPGGITEMSVAAMVLHADVVTVFAFQVFRLIFILLAMPSVLRWRFKKHLDSKVWHEANDRGKRRL